MISLNPLHHHRNPRHKHAHNILESYSQVFAILLSINKGAFILHFDKYDELTDRRLPFQNNKEFPLQEDFFQKFQEAQHKFCAPTLSHLFHREFSNNCILPFERDGLSIARGSSGVIHKIKVHPGYDFLCSASTSQQVRHVSPVCRDLLTLSRIVVRTLFAYSNNSRTKRNL